jgi:hypothetical protein
MPELSKTPTVHKVQIPCNVGNVSSCKLIFILTRDPLEISGPESGLFALTPSATSAHASLSVTCRGRVPDSDRDCGRSGSELMATKRPPGRAQAAAERSLSTDSERGCRFRVWLPLRLTDAH